MKKATRSEEQGSQSHGQNTTASQALTKIARILEQMLFSGSLIRFEAERIGDHYLHSTISALANGYGIAFKGLPERVPNHWGLPCDVIRYSLPGSERRCANDVLLMQSKHSNGPPKAAA